ncbi:MAG: LPP20 family lipoprotein [Elusimicrobiota bacterium]|jgi:hypothetical protein|nr:LPP20 family lipoprotein [Elusimicrobiota bacterium]
MKKNKFIAALFCFVLFFSAVNLSYGQAGADWINDPEGAGVVSSKDIYAVGEGTSLSAAQADARAGILKVFETNIDSRFSGSLSGNVDGESQRLSKEEIQETSKGIVKGITISKTYQGGGKFYALAILDKQKTINELAYDIENLDAKMQILLEAADPATINQLKKMHAQRDDMNRKYLFLTGKSIPATISAKDIDDVSKKVQPLSFYLAFTEGYSKGITPLRNNLTRLILNHGFTIANNITTADRALTIWITLEQDDINVTGFEKWTTTFRIENKSGSKSIGVVSQEYSETGRSIDQCFNKSLAKFQQYLTQNYENLLK